MHRRIKHAFDILIENRQFSFRFQKKNVSQQCTTSVEMKRSKKNMSELKYVAIRAYYTHIRRVIKRWMIKKDQK